MGLRRALHMMGIGALTGALLLGSASTASADDIRDRQWALDFFAAQDIWKHATGKGVTVAVVDSGVDASFPDIKGNVLKGKNFTDRDGGAHEDNDGHGTGMASLIAGHGHGPGGKSGVMGLAPDAKILPLKVSDDALGIGARTDLAIRYAADHGAKVINVSLGSSSATTLDRRAVAYALKKDVTVVASMGNSGTKNKEYPAALPGVVAVGGLDKSGTVWEDSNRGRHTTVIAPATKNALASTQSPSGYSLGKGTSDATAYTSAAVALVREKYPDLTSGQVINRIVKTALPVAPKGSKPKLPTEDYGYGIIRPFRAVTYDIPAGPKAGPLAQPADKPSNSSAGDSTSGSSSSSDEDSSGWMYVLGPPIVLFGLIALVLVGLAVVIVVLVKRKDRSNRVSDPWAAGGGPGVPPQQFPGQQFPGQQQPPAPTGQFGQAPPPPPNQPPSQ